MSVLQSFVLALKGLLSNKMRSILTMLGIIIGVSAVILLVGLVGGYSNSLTSTFEDMGTNTISANIMSGRSSKTVSVNDMTGFIEENTDIFSAYTPIVTLSATLKNGTVSIDSQTCTGVNEMYSDIEALALSRGRFLQYLDCERKTKVCVIGSYQAAELFDGGSALGQTVSISGNHFTVVGILAQTDGGEEGSADDCVYIPYTTASKLGMSRISSYEFMVSDADYAEQGVARLEACLTDLLGSDSAYRVSSAQEMISTVTELTGTLTLVLVGIAGISLLVGGIGIMNIMIVSVTERTREIGIRKSLGARRRDILGQFLIEAMTTSALGGVIGILAGVFTAVPVGQLMGITAAVSVNAIIISFSVSAGIGVIFGFFPARKAARLNPIDALKYE